MALVTIITPLLFFVAFILLLLVTLSVPIAKSIWLFSIGANVNIGSGFLGASAKGEVRFGVLGYCIQSITARAAGFSQTIPGECSPTKLGYKIDERVEQFLDTIANENLNDVIQRALTVVLVLHPIACGLAFLAFLLAVWSLIRSGKGRFTSILATTSAVIAALLATIVFIIDIVLVAVARSRIRNATEGQAYADWGNAVWMCLGAMLALWIGTVTACLSIFARRRRAKSTERY